MLTGKDYCDYETSITLGELGFPLKRMKVKNFIDGKFSDSIVTVLLYEAQKWLREEKRMLLQPAYIESFDEWVCVIRNNNKRFVYPTQKRKTYEEVLLEGIKEAVKILTNEK